MGIINFLLEPWFPPDEGLLITPFLLKNFINPSITSSQINTDLLHIFPLSKQHSREIAHQLKFNNNKEVAKHTARLLEWSIDRLYYVHSKQRGNPVIIFLPPRAYRIRDIGYDQLELLHSFLPTRYNPYILNKSLKRIDNRRQQSLLSKEERLFNSDHIFEITTNLDNKWVIIIDDICTTGATLLDACRACIEKNALHVTGLTIFGQ